MILILLFILLSSITPAQSVSITVTGTEKQGIALYSLKGEKSAFVDSIKNSGSGVFRFTADKSKYPVGMYRVALDNRTSFNIIMDGGDIQLETAYASALDSMHVHISESNKLFYRFVKLQKEFRLKSDLLQLVISRYPKDDDYFTASVSKLQAVQSSYKQFISEVNDKLPRSFISEYINSMQAVFPNEILPPEKQLMFLKQHGLDNVNFTDFSLIHSDAFTNKAIEYLTYYRNPQLPKELLEQEFMKAVDSLLMRARVNQIVYQHITEYLVDGFKQYGFDNLIDYIVTNFVIKDDLCLGEQTEAMLKNRIDQAKYFKKGAKVPPLSFNTSSGKQHNLLENLAKKTVVVFYATWCPHCKEMLPKLYELYKKRQDLNVIAISLDTKAEDWQAFTEKQCPDWVNMCDLKGWEGEAAKDYFIYATPTMFLIDKNGTLISRPAKIEEIE